MLQLENCGWWFSHQITELCYGNSDFFSYFLLLRAITLSFWSLGLISSLITPSWCSSLQNWLILNVSFLMWPNKESNKNLQHHRFTTNKLENMLSSMTKSLDYLNLWKFKVVIDGLASLNANEKKWDDQWQLKPRVTNHEIDLT